jgi:glycosyltransferase involved in cell wall biosynthesis
VYAPAKLDRDGLLVLAIGRLVPEKGFDILLDAFAALSPPFHSAELIIAGTGPLKDALMQQAQALRIDHRVHFPGHVPDPICHFPHASLFLLSSRTEGLPNALLEAAASGLPVVATPASPGLIDLLQNQDGAWIAIDVSSGALRIALETALNGIQSRNRFNHAWIDQYDLSRAIPAYEAVIDRVIAGRES